MKPKTISEQLQYSTVRLVTASGSTGTGFFFEFSFEGKKVPVIVTNKHVIKGNQNEEVSFFLHTQKGDNLESSKLNVKFNTKWHFHKDKDLCFCFVSPLFQQIKEKMGKEVFCISISEDLIWDNSKLKELNAIEDVVMVGYPNGLWDQENNFPLFRKGITSLHPAVNFNGNNIGMVDMACFPGSSGSPIFVLTEKGFVDKKGDSLSVGSRLIFLGILFQAPTMSEKGELIIEDIPTRQTILPRTSLMINLGYYIKAFEVLSFKKEIEALLLKS